MASLKPERSVQASFGAGTLMALLSPFTTKLCNAAAAASAEWHGFWLNILDPMATTTFQGAVIVAVMSIVTWAVPDKRPPPLPAEENSGGQGGMPAIPKGD